MLYALDQPGIRAIAVMPIPTHGLGHAINDRLARAAAPRGEDDKGAPSVCDDPFPNLSALDKGDG